MNKKILIIACSIIALVISISLILILANDKKIETYKVSFETIGGTTINEQVVKEDGKVVKPKDPTKKGYVFVQWLYENETYDFSSKVNSDLVLTAEWIKKEQQIETFIVKFNSDGGTTIPNQIVEKGNKVTIPAAPTKQGYIFIEWQANGSKYDFKKIIEEDLELFAKWQKIENKNDKPVNNNVQKPVNSEINNNNNNNSSTNNTATKPSKNEVKLTIPTIVKGGYGADGEGTVGMELKLNSTDGITGIEIYSSTAENGTYTLQKTVKKEEWNSSTSTVYAKKGQHLYFKVRTYVKNNAGTFYSGYSNVVELNNLN